MNGLDLLLVLVAVAAAVGGFRLGFLARVTSWVGLLVGVVGGSLLLPGLVHRYESSLPRDRLLLVAMVVVAVCGVVGQALGLVVGARLQLALPSGVPRRADAVAGGVAGLLGVAVFAWLLSPAMADVPGWPARQARGSTVVGAVRDAFPPPPDASQSLRRLLGDRYPQVLDAFQQAPDVGPPPASSGLSQSTAERVQRSTVKVLGPACGRLQEGSGFVVAENLIATNAHVVAGEDRTQVESSDGKVHDGRVVAFDPARDLALVSVPSLDRPVLPLQDAAVGDRGAVFGHPGGGPLRLAPFTVGRRMVASGTDIYDRSGTDRRILVLAAALRPGDSGSALVDPTGAVIGVAFAIAPDRPDVAYALDTAELEAVLAAPHEAPVGTGTCLD